MNISVHGKLSGSILAPISKSCLHRILFASSLCDKSTLIETDTNFSDDILATIDCLKKLGTEIKTKENGILVSPKNFSKECLLHPKSSAFTFRILIAIVLAKGISVTFKRNKDLSKRPFLHLLSSFRKFGVSYKECNDFLTISGSLKCGSYKIEGDVSSQYISALLFALPLLDGTSEIIVNGKISSKAYIELTHECLSKFGVSCERKEFGFTIRKQKYISPEKISVERDWSSASFWHAANKLGNNIKVLGLNTKSLQPDKNIIRILRNIENDTEIDANGFPDLVPIICVLASCCSKKTVVKNVSKLRTKESDRLNSIKTSLENIGGKITVRENKIVIFGCDKFIGGTIDSFNDHRIAMALAIASTNSINPVIIKGAGCVNKSYPDFFKHFKLLGGSVCEI